MAGACETCGSDLQPPVTGRSLSANAKLSNVKLGQILRDIGWKVEPEKLWVSKRCCWRCVTILEKWNTLCMKAENISCAWSERTGAGPLPLPVSKRKSRIQGEREQLMNMIQSSRYGLAFRKLITFSSAKKAWIKEIKRTIRKEAKKVAKMSTIFQPSSAPSTSLEFDWNSALAQVKKEAPTLYAAFFAAITTQDEISSKKKVRECTKKRLGMMLLIPMHHRHPRHHRLIPDALSTSLWSFSSREKAINTLRELGICKSVSTAMRNLDDRKMSNDETVLLWRSSIEKQREQQILGHSDTKVAGQIRHTDPGFHFVACSIAAKESKEHQEEDFQKNLKSRVLAVKNRVSFSDVPDGPTLKASELPLSTYLPSQDDYDKLRMRMRVIVERILKANLDVFADETPLKHIPHKYSKECSRKSKCVNLEVIVQNQNDEIGDVAKVLQRLSNFIPDGYDIPLHGDQKTVHLASGAKIACSTAKKNLREFNPVAQDFQFRAVIIKDIMGELFTPTKRTERGTLKNLKTLFRHKSVDGQVTHFHHTEDFLLFIACSFVVAFAMTIMHEPSKQRRWKPDLSKVAEEVVRRIWHQIPMNHIADTINAEIDGPDDHMCVCKQEKDDIMVECSNVQCPNGRWFHATCIRYEEELAGEEWFCSEECERSNNGPFCICRKKQDEGPTWTCANQSCERGQKFHHQCVRSTFQQGQDGDWYCCVECAWEDGVGDERDGVMDYLQKAAYSSLFNECIRDAQREGDGTAIMSYWRISMPEMYLRGHEEFLAVGHRLLSGVSGCFPTRIREEVVHNRTINITGGKGKNIPLDFGTEHMIHCVNDLWRKAQGHVSESTLDKVTKLAGPLGNKLDTTKQPGGRQTRSRFMRYADDVKTFVSDFGDMFSPQKGRSIPSLRKKPLGQEIPEEKAAALKETLVGLNQRIDKEIRVNNLVFPYHNN